MMDLGSFFAELKRHNVMTKSRNLGILPNLVSRGHRLQAYVTRSTQAESWWPPKGL